MAENIKSARIVEFFNQDGTITTCTSIFLFYKLCHNTKKTLQIVTGNHNSFWPITVIPK